MQTEHNAVGTQGSTDGCEHIGREQCVFARLSAQPEADVDDDPGDDIADGRQQPHAAHHPEGEGNHALHSAHQTGTPEDRDHSCAHHQKQQGKGRADAAGNVQPVRDEIRHRGNEPLGKQSHITA